MQDKDFAEYILLCYPVVHNHGQKFDGTTEIPIGYFKAREMMEPTLIRWIHNICTLHPAFQIDHENEFAGHFQKLEQLAISLQLLNEFLTSNGCEKFHAMKGFGYLNAKTKSDNDLTQLNLHEHLIDRIQLIKKTIDNVEPQLVSTFALAPKVIAA